MKIFNARLDVLSVIQQTTSSWSVDATIIDNSGQFIATDVMVSDIVYCYALTNAFELVVSRYKVTVIDSASGVTVKLLFTWDEPNTEYAEPQVGADCIIGRPLPGGVTSITSSSNGVGNDILQIARNIDLKIASFNATVDMTPTTISSISGVLTLPAIGSSLFLVNGTEDLIRIAGRTKGEFVIIWNFSRNINYTSSILEPNSQQSRLVGQGEISSFVFVGSCVKETSQPGGNFALDGGGF